MDTFSVLKILLALSFPPASLVVAVLLALVLGDGLVALVTSAYHMPRALQIASRAGLDVGAFPTDYQATPSVRLPWDNWMPSIDGLGSLIMAIKELIALNFDFRRASPIP